MFPAFHHRYVSLPSRMRAECEPTPVTAPRLLAFNHALAEELGLDLDAFDGKRVAEALSGNAVPESAQPVAAAYAGHQFGNFVPQLGDGRALLLGELKHRNGGLYEVQLKGAGRTPFSRGGDGRAPLGPVLREYLVSEAMHALGVPTTRALAAVSTGEMVLRQLPEPGAVLTRVASSHLRVGTFQYFSVRSDREALELLVDLAIERHYPNLLDDLQEASWSEKALALLEAVVARQARLVAQWKGLGFIHGVMNTDNCAISGETIDYGPCAFMDEFHPRTVFSSIDEGGRYAWINQPPIAQWNLARFGETLLSLIDEDQQKAIELATKPIVAFSDIYQREWTTVLRAKLGLSASSEIADGDDLALGEALLDAMDKAGADFTLTFRHLAGAISPEGGSALENNLENELRAGFSDGTGVNGQGEGAKALEAWLPRWRQRLAREVLTESEIRRRMEATNPLVIPRNHLVEKVIRAAADDDDFTPFERLLEAVTQPFSMPDDPGFLEPPRPAERVLRTFCGT
ncbi:protein adenylyltransferase SelO [Halomonas binhaiensis]|uniref:Protein nucleotidyltransferase YdiU n=1 Tax=Halomonas binhaiensis TaxID=2562282 RepID=A0A5C1NJZ3_9GAMM|nr:YdiU family protein [Halomonas binhaiensis]QEM83100.1 YdiU family protein [Halomonas binhaiensis]